MIARKPKSPEKIEEERIEAKRMELFHALVWSGRKHESEISGVPLGTEPKSIYFHHILPKSTYPEAKYDTENIILLTGREHETVEAFPTYYPKINELRAKLKEKYERIRTQKDRS